MRTCALSILILMSTITQQSAGEFPDAKRLPASEALPDPLVCLDGLRIETPAQWHDKRRPELKKLFQHYMYGYFPAAPEKFRAKELFKNEKALSGKATLTETEIHFGPKGCPPIRVLLAVPNARKSAVPVFVGMNFNGNHTLLYDRQIAIPTSWVRPHRPTVEKGRATEHGRGRSVKVWNIENSIDRGYAVASLYCGDIDPDRPRFEEGIHPFYLKSGQAEPGPHDWGTIAAWAWGVSRAVDFLVEQPRIDNSKIVAVGHSRLGKTCLLAAAFDDRIAMAIPNQAGCGGTAPSRGKVGESVKQINDRFPHWFNGAFKQFNDEPERLPFDQHCLVALVAPRPVLFTNAQRDTWANPNGQFEVLKAADPVYKLLGHEGLKIQARPELDQLSDGRLGYYIRPGRHSMTLKDWNVYLDFAAAHGVK